MVDLNPIKVVKSSAGSLSPVNVQYAIGGLVGVGDGSFINSSRGPYTDASEVLTDYPDVDALRGHTAIYRSALLFFDNGGRELYICETTTEAEQTDTQNGTGVREITVAGVTLQMEAGTVKVSVDNTIKDGSALVQLTEGTDYIVNYSSGKVCLKVAAAVGTNNVEVKFKETTATHVETALTYLETRGINIVFAANHYQEASLTKIKTHCTTAATNGKPRRCYLNGVYFDVSSISTFAGTLNTERVSLFSNRSGYYDAAATDPSTDWLEFQDVAAAVAGVKCSDFPWESLHYKPVSVTWYQQFNSTDIGTLTTAKVNFLDDPEWLTGTGKVIWQGWTVDGSLEFIYEDEIATYDYIDVLLKATLTTPQIVGHIKLSNLGDVTRLYNLLYYIHQLLFEAGAIADPATVYDRFEVHPVVFPLYDALVSLSNGTVTTYQTNTINTAEDTRGSNVYFAYRQAKSLHELTVYLTPL